MKIIEKGIFDNDELSNDELIKVNGSFCGTHSYCSRELSIAYICKPRIGGTDTCFNFKKTILKKEA